MKQLRPMYVIRQGEGDEYADFLHQDRDKAYNWQWVKEIGDARWLTVEMLPTAFQAPAPTDHVRIAEMIIKIPKKDIMFDSFDSQVEMAVFQVETAVFQLVKVHPGWQNV